MHVLIIGGTGFIGTRLSSHLVRRGDTVTVFASDPPNAGTATAGVRWIGGDRRRPRDLRAVRGTRVDAVVDLIAYDHPNVAPLPALFSGCVDRYVMLSTVAVYRELRATPTPEDGAVTWSATGPSYAAAKVRAEHAILSAHRESGFPAVILRAAPLCGPGDPASRENYFLRRLTRRRPILHCGPVDGTVLNLFADDLIDAIGEALRRPAVAGQVLHLAQPEHVTLGEYVGRIAALARAAPPRFVVRPLPELAAAGFSPFAFPYAPAAPGVLDVAKARDLLGFSPTPWGRALERVVGDLRARGPRHAAAWPGLGTTQSRLAAAHPVLHDQHEIRYLAGGTAPHDMPDADTVLDGLTCCHGVRAHDAESFHAAGRLPPGAGAVVLAPADLIDRYDLPVTRHVRARHGERPRLVAALESLQAAPGVTTAWLYTHPPRGGIAHYGRGHAVFRVSFIGTLADLPSRAENGHRYVLCPREPDDLAAPEYSLATLPEYSLATLARTYLLRPGRWANHPTAHLLALARLLLRAGAPSERRLHPVLPGPEAQTRWPLGTPTRPPVCLGDRYLLVDVAAGKVFEPTAGAVPADPQFTLS